MFNIGISDTIAAFILQRLADENGAAEFSRTELAKFFACVPSQINYVLSTRFTPEHGYIIESRRGEGGYIRIRRVELTKGNAVMHIVNSIGSGIDLASAQAYLKNMYLSEIIDRRSAVIISAAISNKALASIPYDYRAEVRASILKQCLINLT